MAGEFFTARPVVFEMRSPKFDGTNIDAVKNLTDHQVVQDANGNWYCDNYSPFLGRCWIEKGFYYEGIYDDGTMGLRRIDMSRYQQVDPEAAKNELLYQLVPRNSSPQAGTGVVSGSGSVRVG